MRVPGSVGEVNRRVDFTGDCTIEPDLLVGLGLAEQGLFWEVKIGGLA